MKSNKNKRQCIQLNTFLTGFALTAVGLPSTASPQGPHTSSKGQRNTFLNLGENSILIFRLRWKMKTASQTT